MAEGRVYRDVLAAVGVFALGWMVAVGHGRPATVHAAAESFQFQLQDMRPSSALLVYSESDKTIYVYQGATTGNAALQCSYKFRMTSLGGVIRREPCPVPSLNR